MTDFLTFNFRTDTESYKSRELLLQNLYDKYGSDVDYEKLYREFQTVNEDIVTDIEPKVCEFGKLNKSGLLWTNADRYWLYVNKRNVSSMDIIIWILLKCMQRLWILLFYLIFIMELYRC